MTVDVFFGQVDRKESPDAGNVFFDPNSGKEFWYKLDIEDDEIYLQDTVGRIFPIDRQSVSTLGTAIFIANSLYKAQEEAETLLERRMKEIGMVVEHIEPTLSATLYATS